jgi:hypothetical protein
MVCSYCRQKTITIPHTIKTCPYHIRNEIKYCKRAVTNINEGIAFGVSASETRLDSIMKDLDTLLKRKWKLEKKGLVIPKKTTVSQPVPVVRLYYGEC